MRFLYALLILTFSATALLADKWPRKTELGQVLTETRFGPLNEIEVYFDEGSGWEEPSRGFSLYSINGQEIAGLKGWLHVLQVFDWGDRGDVILLNLWSGGASCCNSYRILRVHEDGVDLSDEFADHGHSASGFDVTPDAITFVMQRDFPADIHHWELVYDGDAVDLTVIMEDDTDVPPAGAGEDVTRWRNAIHNILEAPDERQRFRQIMNDEELNELRLRMQNGITIGTDHGTTIDRFLMRHGFPQHQGTNSGYLAIEVSTGNPFAAYWTCEGLKTFGADEENLPAPMLDLINHDRDRFADNRFPIGPHCPDSQAVNSPQTKWCVDILSRGHLDYTLYRCPK